MKRIRILLSVLALCACNHQDPVIINNVSEDDISHGMIVLGDRLEDPYTVENMTRALKSLYPTKAGGGLVNTTHLYVRFLPTNDEQFTMLENMGVEMLDHPVDYQIVREGDYYHDPEISEGEMTWQYTVLPSDFEIPEGLHYEILDRCHISEGEHSTRSRDGVDWDAVERESFRLTGNAHLLPPLTRGDDDNIPKGRICIVDDVKGGEPIGVAGVKVSCNIFVKFAHAYTDEDGYYNMSRAFASSPRYRLVFKNKKGFGIGLNLILIPGSVSTLGKRPASGYSVVIDNKSDRMLFKRCVVNNACWDYYNLCKTESGNICTPPNNLRIWILDFLQASSTVMMQQGVGIDGTIIEQFLEKYTPLVKMLLPDITLGLGDKRDYASIYATTVHELAHASHYMQVGKDYWNTLEMYILTSFVSSGFETYGVGTEENHGYCEVAEMWAYYMQTRIHNLRYPGAKRYFGMDYWFHPQIFNYLDERGLSCYKTFNALLPSVHDKDDLKQKLIQLYPEAALMIKLAFSMNK